MTTKNAVGNSLTGSTGSGAFVGATSPTLVTPALGTPASGNLASCTGYLEKVVQRVSTQTGAVSTTTTTIPLDDTIPQNTEGAEFMSLSITPTNSSNILAITVTVDGANSALSHVIAALFQDSTANAIAALAGPGSAAYVQPLTFTHYMTAGTTSSTTFKVRAGGSAAGTYTFNGASGGRYFGGVIASSIHIVEYKV